MNGMTTPGLVLFLYSREGGRSPGRLTSFRRRYALDVKVIQI
jgi:hypothetical protein